ncbi:MAG: hypothetical protein IIB65_13320 [Proteobacteria bacterium]|nr:hypothetical protein [Pseudomonadota bacterium]MCH8091363.1 hypothetical protein [Pseudomonadota bacterium]
MLLIRQLVLYAARRIAADPRVRAKAADLLETEIKPRAKAAWAETKPKIEAAAAELKDIARETRPLKHPAKFAAKLKERLRQGGEEEEDQGGSGRDT